MSLIYICQCVDFYTRVPFIIIKWELLTVGRSLCIIWSIIYKDIAKDSIEGKQNAFALMFLVRAVQSLQRNIFYM